MPNGGSDCCGTCWFNARNKGEAGYKRASDRDPVPIGPVFIADDGFPYHRNPLHASPDTEEVRLHLLELLQAMEEQPKEEYPAGMYVDEMVVWQLGEFRERRANAGLVC